MIENLPESNGSIFIHDSKVLKIFDSRSKMPTNYHDHSTRLKTSIRTYLILYPAQFKNFGILPMYWYYRILRTLGGIFATLYTLMAPLKTAPFTVAWYYTGRSSTDLLEYLFNIKTGYHLLNFRYQIILCNTRIAKISVVFLQHLRTDQRVLQTTPYVPTCITSYRLTSDCSFDCMHLLHYSVHVIRKRCVES